jgi:hypothetical protein
LVLIILLIESLSIRILLIVDNSFLSIAFPTQQQQDAPLSLPQLNRLFEVSFAWDESSVSNAGVAMNE